jgi:hypothetical protein
VVTLAPRTLNTVLSNFERFPASGCRRGLRDKRFGGSARLDSMQPSSAIKPSRNTVMQ